MPHRLHARHLTRQLLNAITLGAAALVFAAFTPAFAASPDKSTKQEPSKSSTKLPAATATQKSNPKTGKTAAKKKPDMTMDQFLDRLMIAESGGNDNARNPLSTATGAYQFIRSTFLSVMQRHFAKRVEKLNNAQILALRTDRVIAREAAKAYTQDNATHLAAAGHKPTFPHLRLAFLLGAGGATRILDAKPATQLVSLLGPGVIRANPWMTRHTAQSLVARAAREVSLSPTSLAGIKPRRDPITGKLIFPKRIARRPRIRVRCNLARPSCKRWLSLKRKRLARKKRNKKSGKSSRHVAQKR